MRILYFLFNIMNAIALDFGTTNSQIAYKDKAGIIRSIEVDGDAKIPTSIYYSLADKQFFFGQKAELAYADACADAGNDFSRYSKIISRFQSHFKPELTKAAVEPEAFSPLFGEDEKVPLTWGEVLTAFFRYFKQLAEEKVFLRESVEKLRLTHPVAFPSKELYESAALAAGFSVIEFVSEPEAAHAAYAGSMKHPDENILIFDMGGGTLDICQLCKRGETWKVEQEPLRIDTAGKHIDTALVRSLLTDINAFLTDKLGDNFSPSFRADEALLLHVRKSLKEPLGAHFRRHVDFRYDLDAYGDLTFRKKNYTVEMLDNVVEATMRSAFSELKRYVNSLPEQPSCILMVGGSSRMVCIQERLKAIFPNIPVYTPNGGDKAVAEGALHAVTICTLLRTQLHSALREAFIHTEYWDFFRTIEQGADVNTKDKNGQTSLHLAVKFCDTKLCKLLLQHGADVNTKDKDGRTPLHDAAQRCYESCELLLQHGADVNAKDKHGWTPLHVTVRWNEAMFDSRAKICKLMLQHGADVDATDISTQLNLKIFEAFFQILR